MFRSYHVLIFPCEYRSGKRSSHQNKEHTQIIPTNERRRLYTKVETQQTSARRILEKEETESEEYGRTYTVHATISLRIHIAPTGSVITTHN